MADGSSLAPELGAELRAWLASADPWRLVRGESLALLTQLPSQFADAVITDSPYSSGGQFRGDRAGKTGEKYVGTNVRRHERQQLRQRADFEGDTRDQLSFILWASLWSTECFRVAKPGAIVGFWTDWRQVAATIAALQGGGWVYRGLWGWDKTEGCRPVKGRPRNQLELVVWGSKGAMPTTRCGGIIEPGVARACSATGGKGGHQTGKPVEVCRVWARLCEPGGILLDPFSGGASQGVACLEERRRYLGFEVVPRIHAEAVERLTQWGQVAAAKPNQLGLFGGAC